MSDLLSSDIEALTTDLCAAIQSLALAERIEALNRVRRALHEVSPFRAEPVDCVQWVPAAEVVANQYNPNNVAPPEMRLLEHSIRRDGYTQPIVASPEAPVSEGARPVNVVVDGYHRNRVGRECRAVRERLHGYLPITLIRPERAGLRDRIASTIRHNRARGVHGVLPMADLVANLLRDGATDDEVARELGMDPDEVLRFKQTTGLPELFANRQYSRAWE